MKDGGRTGGGGVSEERCAAPLERHATAGLPGEVVDTRYWVWEQWVGWRTALPAAGRRGRRRTGGANPDQGAICKIQGFYCKYSDRDY